MNTIFLKTIEWIENHVSFFYQVKNDLLIKDFLFECVENNSKVIIQQNIEKIIVGHQEKQ